MRSELACGERNGSVSQTDRRTAGQTDRRTGGQPDRRTAGWTGSTGAEVCGVCLSSQPRPRRTRLTPEREGELYEAVLALLRESGYDALTMEGVAARSRSSKATLYRQWGTKPKLVAEALRHHRPFSLDNLDT